MGDNNSRSNGKIIKFPDKASMEREYFAPEPEEPAVQPEAAPVRPIVPPAPKSAVDRFLALKKTSSFVRTVIMALPSWVTPNAVTWFRMALVVPIVYLLRQGSYWPAFTVAVVALALDFVDGAIAEIRNMKSESGAFLDPLADKVLICGIILSLSDRLPVAIGLLGVAVALVAVCLTMLRILKMARHTRRYETVRPSIAAKAPGKLKMIAETASVFLIIGGLALAVPALVWAGGATLLAALILAGWSFMSQLTS